ICKATLKLSLSDKEYIGSSSDTEEEVEKVVKNKTKVFRKKRKKKKVTKKRIVLQEHSDSELIYKKSTATSLSVFDLIANEKIPSPTLTCPRTPQHRALTEKKNEITKQLAEVQAKLYTLKNKLWFGVDQGDAPLATSRSSFYFSTTKSISTQKTTRKTSKKNTKKVDKSAKRDTKAGLDKMDKYGGKTQNGLKRQTTINWIPSQKLSLRKSKSLPDTSSSIKDKLKDMNLDEEKTPQSDKSKKKKQRKHKFSKKAKALSNAKIFVA
ncbi:hypothetical protein GWI33_005817, partial [Rhynchophorus ferrugineus]